jgi:hypothetical protein
MSESNSIETFDYGGYKEKAFKGPSYEALRAAADFLERSNDISPRTIQVLEITPSRWRIAVFYKEIE